MSPGRPMDATTYEPKSLEERLDRMESADAIRRLVARYSNIVDVSDVSQLGALFVEDVRTSHVTESGATEVRAGREALQNWFASTKQCGLPREHFIGNHTIDFTGRDTATGILYGMTSAATAEGPWTLTGLKYLDKYVREAGEWLFRSRRFVVLYVADLKLRPGPFEGWGAPRSAEVMGRQG